MGPIRLLFSAKGSGVDLRMVVDDHDQRADYGQPGDQPIVGDFNGDEVDERVVRGDVWIIDTDGDHRITGNDQQIVIPRPSEDSQPVVGDFDGDGLDEPGYYDEGDDVSGHDVHLMRQPARTSVVVLTSGHSDRKLATSLARECPFEFFEACQSARDRQNRF